MLEIEKQTIKFRAKKTGDNSKNHLLYFSILMYPLIMKKHNLYQLFSIMWGQGAKGLGGTGLEQEWGQGLCQAWKSCPEIDRSRIASSCPGPMHHRAHSHVNPPLPTRGGDVAL